MVFGLRKFLVWFISLGVVLTIYLLTSWLGETPQIDIGPAAEPAGPAADFNSQIGMIGDVGVGEVQIAEFITRNEKTKEVERIFGFEKLLYEEGDKWEIEKPYMNIFRPNLKCYITADKGQVQLETAAGRTSPKDATLTGNVVIHILPENASNIKEGFIYLDDVIFISDKSQFSTAGPVELVSQNARMLGRGLELVYNNEQDRLEVLRVIDLESLHFKTSSKASLFPSGQGNKGYKQRTTSDERRATNYYRCVFSKNVVIDTPEQLILADKVSINNISSSKSSSKKSNKADTANEDSVEITNVTVAEQNEPNESTEQFVDIVVTCDNGIVVTPMDSPIAYGSPGESGADAGSGSRHRKILEDVGELKKYTLLTPNLTVDLSKEPASGGDIEHVTASGGTSQLAVVKKNRQELLGFTKLKAVRFDYDRPRRLFLATRGLIAVDNSKVSEVGEPNSEAGRFSLQRPCYAIIENFNTLKYFLETNRIIADAGRNAMLINYFPIVNGQCGQRVAATAGHVEANLTQTADGRTELSTLTASGGITYEGEDKQFAGSKLFYDANESIITVQGDEFQPCLLNGALVDAIEWDLKTDRVKAEILGPGALPMRKE